MPLLLAIGLGFGILTMASVGPIITAMLSGLWARYKASAQVCAAVPLKPAITYLTDAVLITAIVSTGKADIILKAVRDVGGPGDIVHVTRSIGPRRHLVTYIPAQGLARM